MIFTKVFELQIQILLFFLYHSFLYTQIYFTYTNKLVLSHFSREQAQEEINPKIN